MIENTPKKRGKPRNWLTLDQLQQIFSNIESILMFHGIFLSQLNQRIAYDLDVQTCIGDIFVAQVPLSLFLLLFPSFSSPFPLSPSFSSPFPASSSFSPSLFPFLVLSLYASVLTLVQFIFSREFNFIDERSKTE